MKPIVFLKAHIDTYTRKDGAVVQAHEDKRSSQKQTKPFQSTLPPKPSLDVKSAREYVDRVVEGATFASPFSQKIPVLIDGKKKQKSLFLIQNFGIAIDRFGQKYSIKSSVAYPLNEIELKDAVEREASELANNRLVIASKRHELHRKIDDVARHAHESGIDTHVVVPNDSTSRYVYLQRGDKKLKIRSADHPQPHDRRADGSYGVVGGYDKDTGVRHDASDLSMDPETGHDVEHVKRLIDTHFAGAPMTKSLEATQSKTTMNHPGEVVPLFFKAHPATRTMIGGDPTPSQAASGVYPKIKMDWHGLRIAIEHPEGTVREGIDETGKPWRTVFKHAYGEIPGTTGLDGDPVDVFIGHEMDAPEVYIIQQMRRKDWNTPDEQKCMINFPSMEDARLAYLEHYDDPRFFGGITAMPVAEFVVKVRRTKENPVMIKSAAVLFFKAHVGPYLRGGKLVNTSGYQGRAARAVATPGQMSLFGGASSGKPLPPSPLNGKDAVAHTPDLFDADEHGEMPPARPAYRQPQHTEPTKELIAEHERLVDVLRSPSHADDKVEAEKQAGELGEMKGEVGERKAVLSPRDLSPEDRAHWSELHEQHKRLVYHDVPKHAAKRDKLLSQMRDHEATSHSAMLDEMQSANFGDSRRALQMNEAKNAFRQKAREVGSKIHLHDQKTSELQNRISDLAERKGKMVLGTHDLRFDTASQSLRSVEDEAAFAKDEMKRQRSMKPEPMAKSILFLTAAR